MFMNNLAHMANTVTRSISAENITGEPGKGGSIPLEQGTAMNAARDLGIGWKVNPYLILQPGEVTTIADIKGPGTIEHIWMTPAAGDWRNMILRIYWDDCPIPAVECPVGDFFACGWGKYAQISSLAVCVNPSRSFNCYWAMPFKSHCRMTFENKTEAVLGLYYQVTYELGEVNENAAYFHTQFRRTNPLPYKEVFTILDNIKGKGQYVGTYMAWGVNNCGWWGEGEIKFYMDGDREFPTICGTGTEDYFCGSYNFDVNGQYVEFSTPYSGLAQVIRPDGTYSSQTRFSLYRWHIPDPIRFEKDLRVTIQALGWRSGGRYLPLQDDMAAVAFFYLDKPCTNIPKLPGKDEMEII